MELIQIYAKEIFSLLVPLVIWILNDKFRARAKLQIAQPHRFTFLVDEPLKDEKGGLVYAKQTVHTVTHTIRNSGKETAMNVELVFNWQPLCVNIWPSRHYKEYTEQDGRYILIFDSLAPNEIIGCELLSVNRDLPDLINSRSDQCVASTVEMYPQPIIPAWKRRIAIVLSFAGISFMVYMSILLLQFLVVN